MKRKYPKQSQWIGKMVKVTRIHEIECEVCGNEFVDEVDSTKSEFVNFLRRSGWAYGWDEENGVEGVICPDCLPVDD